MQVRTIGDIRTDVVVIGSGAAGLRAAIEARRHDVEVLIVSANRIGHASNSSISHGGFSTSMCQEGDSPERFFEDTIKGGAYLNSKVLVRMLSTGISSEVTTLEKMGVIFRRSPGGSYVFEKRGGHSLARRLTTLPRSGMGLLLPVLKAAEKARVKFCGGVKAVVLLTRRGRICGLLGFDRGGECICVFGKAVILATGGGGALYARTTNVPWAKGGGYALAYETGLALQDMEFVQFVLAHMRDPGVPARIPPAEVFLLSGADLVDRSGGSILKGVDLLTRDSISRAAAKALETDHEGPGGCVYLDLRNCELAKANNIPNLRVSCIRVFPAAHFVMGGVRVREDLTTSIEGLYAAGESMGGVHGANRLGGNALAEAFVFGASAGRLAARFAKTYSPSPISLSYALSALEDRTSLRLGIKSKRSILLDIAELTGQLKMIMQAGAAVLRNRKELEGGLRAVERLRTGFGQLPRPNPQELWEWFDLSHSLTVAEMIFRGCLERKESRGAHYREDFQRTGDDEWLTNICINRDNQGGMEITRATV